MNTFLNAILGAFGGVSGVIQTLFAILSYLFQVIVYVAALLYNFIVTVGNFFLKLFGVVSKFLGNLWNGVIKNIFTRVLSVLQKAHDWLEQRLRPIIKFLQKIRALQDAYFRRYLKPLLDMLQHVRQFLQLLRLLNISFAAQLDNYIAGLEARLAQTFATLRAAVNNAIDIVNLLADPSLLLRKPVLLLSIRRQLPALIHAVTGRPPGYWFPSPRGSSGGAFAPVGSNFTPTDPNQNPPTSSYLGFEDGIGNVPPLDIGFTIGVTVVDHVDVLDYFNDALWPAPLCTDPAVCLNAALQTTIARTAHA